MTSLNLVVPGKQSVDTETLDRSLVHGISWTGAVKWFTQILSWTSTIVVARLLSPEDFGLIGMATVYVGMSALVSEFGLGTAIVALRDVTVRQLAQLNATALVVGLAGFVLSCVAAVPLSWFFGVPELRSVVVVLSASLVFDSLRTVPAAVLSRNLEFKYLAVLEGLKAIVGASLAVALAVLGARYWALVIGNLAGTVVMTAVMLLRRPLPFAWPQFRALRSTLSFGTQLVAGHLAWYAYSNADFLIAGRVLGQAALGTYGIAWTVASTPGEKIMSVVARVTPAMFSAVKTEPAALRRYFLLLTECLAMLILPASVGLALVAPEFVLLILGAKWSGAIVPLQLLCCYASFHMLSTLLAPILHVTGHVKFATRCGFLALAIMPAAFYLFATRWGTSGIAVAWLAIYPFVLVPMYVRVFQTLRLTLRRYVASLWPAVRGAAAMALVVLSVRALLPADWPLGTRFSVAVGAGAATYLPIVLIMDGARLRALVELLRGRGR